VKTSLGIWAFGAMATRFNPGGYKPELAGASTAGRVRTAVEGLGDLMDDYEFHFPQELSPANLDAVRDALDGHGIYAIATGTHLNPRYGKGGLSSPDDAVRGDALGEALDAASFASELGAQMILWPGVGSTARRPRRRYSLRCSRTAARWSRSPGWRSRS
jgi:sugar phosphate isomerase/epimerase